MKRRLLPLALSATLTRASAIYGQTPHTADPQKILELVKELQVQQRQIDDNQGKIDAKIAESRLAEMAVDTSPHLIHNSNCRPACGTKCAYR
jgi:hypothetical protein